MAAALHRIAADTDETPAARGVAHALRIGVDRLKMLQKCRDPACDGLRHVGMVTELMNKAARWVYMAAVDEHADELANEQDDQHRGAA